MPEKESEEPMEVGSNEKDNNDDVIVVSSSDAEVAVVGEDKDKSAKSSSSSSKSGKGGKSGDASLLPWVEKYRPAVLGDLISHQDITSTIQKFIDMDQLPHLLFYGPPGSLFDLVLRRLKFDEVKGKGWLGYVT